MKGWNPFGKVDMEVGSFLKASPFNKSYEQKEKDTKPEKSDKENSKKDDS